MRRQKEVWLDGNGLYRCQNSKQVYEETVQAMALEMKSITCLKYLQNLDSAFHRLTTSLADRARKSNFTPSRSRISEKHQCMKTGPELMAL